MLTKVAPLLADFQHYNRYICGLNQEKTAYIIFDRQEQVVVYSLKITTGTNQVTGQNNYSKFTEYISSTFNKSEVSIVNDTNISYKIFHRTLQTNLVKVVKNNFTYADLLQRINDSLFVHKLTFLKIIPKKLNEGIYEIKFIDTTDRYEVDDNKIIANIITRTYDYYYKGAQKKTTGIIDDLIKPDFK